MVKVDEDAKSFDAPLTNELEPPTESTSQVVSQGCQQVVSEVVSQPDAAIIASNNMVGSQEPLKVGDSVIVNCPGLKHHNNQGVVVRLKTEHFQGKELLLADLNISSERRYVEVQLSWLHRVMSETETGG